MVMFNTVMYDDMKVLTELYIFKCLKWKILCYMYFTTKKNSSKNWCLGHTPEDSDLICQPGPECQDLVMFPWVIVGSSLLPLPFLPSLPHLFPFSCPPPPPLPAGLRRSTSGKCLSPCACKQAVLQEQFSQGELHRTRAVRGGFLGSHHHATGVFIGFRLQSHTPLLIMLPFSLHKSRKAFGSCRRWEEAHPQGWEHLPSRAASPDAACRTPTTTTTTKGSSGDLLVPVQGDSNVLGEKRGKFSITSVVRAVLTPVLPAPEYQQKQGPSPQF